MKFKVERTTWHNMKNRCTRPSHNSFSYYAERGIKICKRWEVFENFLADMGPKPTPAHTIERIDNDSGYRPGNCRWALPAEQAKNKRQARRKNSTGYRGVSINRGGRYDVRIFGSFVASFDSVEDAAAAYNKLARKIFGKNAVLNNSI